MATLTLMGFRLSPFVEKVVRALAYKDLAFDLVEPASPFELRRWNPQTRKMPVLDVDGEKTYDSTLILRRLDELRPRPPLFSADAEVATRQRLLEDWSDESLYWMVMAARWSDANTPATASQLAETVAAPLRPIARRMFPRLIRPTVVAQGFGRLPPDVLVSEFGRRLDDLVQLLGDRDFFHADDPSAADFALFGQLTASSSGPTPELAELVSHRPGLVEWMGRVERRTGG